MKKLKQMTQEERLEFLSREHHTNFGYWERKYPEAIVELTNGKRVLFDEMVDICQEERLDELQAHVAVLAKGKKPDLEIAQELLEGLRAEPVDLSGIHSALRELRIFDERLSDRIWSLETKEPVAPVVEHKVEVLKEEISEDKIAEVVKKHLPKPVELPKILDESDVKRICLASMPSLPELPQLPPVVQTVEKIIKEEVSKDVIQEIVSDCICDVEESQEALTSKVEELTKLHLDAVSKLRAEMASHISSLAKQEPVVIKETAPVDELERKMISEIESLRKVYAKNLEVLREDFIRQISKHASNPSVPESIIIREEVDLSSVNSRVDELDEKLSGLEEALSHDPHSQRIDSLESQIASLEIPDVLPLQEKASSLEQSLWRVTNMVKEHAVVSQHAMQISEKKLLITQAVLALVVLFEIIRMAL